ncbi:MAG: phosphomannomutase/phosphoglucomutase [Acidimicrobiia bacterium]|nr:phosphomannomutase/phosphoglucomutase [Acidimicrobiia bacterium]RZV43770.1 MAG: phosphomannomutase/phosphoglucomutase [Acidimicrobiia bacterium]
MNLDAIFKAYDIRGRIDNGDMDADIARRIGAGFAAFSGADRIAVGRDIRTSSTEISAAFIEGATGQGVDVDDIGLIATDMSYYYAGAHDVPAAMITASHLPLNWNGIKLSLAGAKPVSADTGLAEIKALTADPPAAAAEPGSVKVVSTLDEYVDHLYSIVDADSFRPLKVAVDGGNGMAGIVSGPVFARIPVDLTPLYLEPDGTFPNHPADPTRPENLADLIAAMEAEPHDLGVAFDADADRAIFIDDSGVPLSGSTTTAMVARWFLGHNPGATIVHNLITSRAVPETVLKWGGQPVKTRVGHSYIKAVMAETGAVFGGEHSAHFYFRDNYRADSGTLAMLVLMQLMAEDPRPLSEIRTEYEPYAASGEINFIVEDQQGMMDIVAAEMDGESNLLDGLTVEWADEWFNIRPSNTEPLLRLNVEASDADAAAELVARVSEIIVANGGRAG